MSAFATFRDKVRAYGPPLRFCLRVTVAGLAAFAIARSLNLPLRGLWAVLTAIVVSQVSVGGSLRATIEYNIGTIGGAVYAAAVELLVPHSTPVSQAVALALSVAPMAAAAAISPSFRVAPFSAVLVLLIGSELGETPIVSALTRVLEVAIGGMVAVIVSLLVFPERAQGLGLDAASRILRQMAELLPKLLARISGDGDAATIGLAQNALGVAVAQFQGLVEEAKRERFVTFARHPDSAPLSRTLLRIRHDFVIVSRATVRPFPDAVSVRLGPSVARFSEQATAYLRDCAAALAARRAAPPIAPTQAALSAFDAEMAAIRDEGLERVLATADVERLFALAFGLEQFCRDLADLAERIQEHAAGRRPPAAS